MLRFMIFVLLLTGGQSLPPMPEVMTEIPEFFILRHGQTSHPAPPPPPPPNHLQRIAVNPWQEQTFIPTLLHNQPQTEPKDQEVKPVETMAKFQESTIRNILNQNQQQQEHEEKQQLVKEERPFKTSAPNEWNEPVNFSILHPLPEPVKVNFFDHSAEWNRILKELNLLCQRKEGTFAITIISKLIHDSVVVFVEDIIIGLRRCAIPTLREWELIMVSESTNESILIPDSLCRNPCFRIYTKRFCSTVWTSGHWRRTFAARRCSTCSLNAHGVMAKATVTKSQCFTSTNRLWESLAEFE